MIRALLTLTLLAGLVTALPTFAAPETLEQKSCRIFFANVLGPTAEENAILAEVRGNFYKLPAVTPKRADALNQRLLGALRRIPFTAKIAGRARGLTAQQREKLFDEVMALPEVRESLCGSYRGSKVLGFCFNRAVAVHVKALGSAFDKRSVRKLWFVGPLSTGARGWNFHVATIIRGDDGRWYAIDPFFEHVLPVSEWYRALRSRNDPTHTARLFSTAASQLHPDNWKIYAPAELKRKAFQGFFTDVFRTMKRERAGSLPPEPRE